MSAVSTYAEALFEAARERDELEDVLEELQEFTTALDESEELRLFFYGGQIPEREKRRAIDALTEGMTLSTRNFLKVLTDNGREEILEEVLLRYEELVKEHLGRVEVEVTTAVELSDPPPLWTSHQPASWAAPSSDSEDAWWIAVSGGGSRAFGRRCSRGVLSSG